MTPYGFESGWYHCLLDEQPYYLVPGRLYGDDLQGPLFVNPDCWFSWHGAPPASFASRLIGIEHLHPGDWVVWVRDPATAAIWPYWVGQQFIAYLGELAPGYPVTIELPPLVEWVLTRANILVDERTSAARRGAWLRSVEAGAKSLAERGYASVDGLVPPFHLGALRRYYRFHARNGSFALGDDQVGRRHVAHNDGVARFVQFQLTEALSDLARTIVKPSYTYLAGYESGAVLEPHTDREQCEYTMTMAIDATPEPEAQSPWPINLDVADGALSVWQFLGDGLVFRGRYLQHYRFPLGPGQTSTSILFHYVDGEFDGPLD
jgi:hypothetical protein